MSSILYFTWFLLRDMVRLLLGEFMRFEACTYQFTDPSLINQ